MIKWADAIINVYDIIIQGIGNENRKFVIEQSLITRLISASINGYSATEKGKVLLWKELSGVVAWCEMRDEQLSRAGNCTTVYTLGWDELMALPSQFKEEFVKLPNISDKHKNTTVKAFVANKNKNKNNVEKEIINENKRDAIAILSNGEKVPFKSTNCKAANYRAGRIVSDGIKSGKLSTDVKLVDWEWIS